MNDEIKVLIKRKHKLFKIRNKSWKAIDRKLRQKIRTAKFKFKTEIMKGVEFIGSGIKRSNN